jgi:hypothetical protein
MIKETRSFVLRLAGFTAILFLIHFYIITQFFDGQLYFPLWTIHLFNAILVFIVYSIIVYRINQGARKIYQLFLGLTISKMAFAVIFLLPLFFGKSGHAQLEVINFFIPYFLFLAFEIFSLNKFLQKG